MRLIDADALDNAFTRLRFNADWEIAHWGDRKDWCLHGSEVEKLIADAPTVDPVKHGHWEVVDAAEPRRWGCSNCRCLSWHEFYYCPNCGAKMDEVEEDG